MIRPWALPGPAQTLLRYCGALDRHRVLTLHAPRDTEALARSLRDRLDEFGLLRTFAVALDGGRAFVDALAEEIGIRAASAAALAAAPELESAAVVLTMAGNADLGLQSFARLIRRSNVGRTARLLIVSRDGRSAPDGQQPTPVRGAFEPLDGAAYLAQLPRSSRPLEGRLASSVALETAAWDFELLDRLTTLPVERAIRPDLYYEDWDQGRCAEWSGLAPSWEAGVLDEWGGTAAEHPAWLAANQPARLTKRVWRGQLAVLLPWIEEHRLQIIDRESRRLRPDERSGLSVDLLDWGPLIIQLESRAPAVAPQLAPFRQARNELAHARPVCWDLVQRCQLASSRLARP